MSLAFCLDIATACQWHVPMSLAFCLDITTACQWHVAELQYPHPPPPPCHIFPWCLQFVLSGSSSENCPLVFLQITDQLQKLEWSWWDLTCTSSSQMPTRIMTLWFGVSITSLYVHLDFLTGVKYDPPPPNKKKKKETKIHNICNSSAYFLFLSCHKYEVDWGQDEGSFCLFVNIALCLIATGFH